MLTLREYSHYFQFLNQLGRISYFNDDGDFSVTVSKNGKKPFLQRKIKAPSRVVLLREIEKTTAITDDVEINLNCENERAISVKFKKKGEVRKDD